MGRVCAKINNVQMRRIDDPLLVFIATDRRLEADAQRSASAAPSVGRLQHAEVSCPHRLATICAKTIRASSRLRRWFWAMAGKSGPRST